MGGGESLRYWQLLAAASVYHLHFDDLTIVQRGRINELAAMYIVEWELRAKLAGASFGGLV